MRIDEINLMAYGPFAGQPLDFGRGAEGVHIVFGANEAGKSSALRAIRDALFGIPARTSDNFLHRYDAMRIGFSLRSVDGSRYAAIRRKANRKTLLDPQTEEPIDETMLATMLNGVDREAFERMFGLGTESLRAGGQEIATMQGDVGGALFAAAGGLVQLRQILDGLDQDALTIFRARGQNQSLNAAISEFNDLKKNLRDTRHSSRDHKEKTDELDRVRREASVAAAQLREKRAEKNRLERINNSRGQVDSLEAATARVGELASVTILREDFDANLRDVHDAMLAAETSLKNAKDRLNRIDQELEKVSRPAIPRKHWQIARQLSDSLGAFRKACADLPGIRRKAASYRADLEPRLARLRPSLSLEDYEALFISPVDRQGITDIGRRLTKAQTSVSSTEMELQKVGRERSLAMEALEATQVPIDTRSLEAAMTAASKKGHVEEEYSEKTRRCQTEAADIQILLDRAGRWAGSLDQLRKLALPTHVTIDTHETALAESAGEVRRLRDALDEVKAEHARLSNERDEILAVEGDLPSEADVTAARASRDSLWHAIRECWLSKGKEVEGADVSHVDRQDLPAVGNAYDNLVNNADEVVDRVRREHLRVDKRARLESGIRAKACEMEATAKRIDEAEASLDHATQSWRNVWTSVGVNAGTPREMREWLTTVEGIRRRSDALDQSQEDSHRLNEFITKQKRELRDALQGIGDMLSGSVDTLSGLLEHCTAVVGEQATSRVERAGLEAARKQAGERLDAMTKQLEMNRAELAVVKDEWTKALADRSIPEEVNTTGADTWMTECMDIHGRARQLLGPDGSATRIQHIEGDLGSFISYVTDVLRQLGDTATIPDMKTVDDVATGVLERIEQSKEATSVIVKAKKDRDAALDELDEKGRDIEACRSRMAELENEARAEAGANLAELCRRSNELRDLKSKVAGLEDNLQGLAAGMPMQQWIETVRQREGEDLSQRLAELQADIDRLDQETMAKNELVGQLKTELASIGAGTAAIDANAAMQARLGEIEKHAREYARLWVASKVLRRAVDAYREQHQGEVLETASGFFTKLTEGAFRGLAIDDTDDTPVIAGKRAGQSAHVRVEAMSEGTMDQLFLALRLAFIEIRARHHEPMPLILDDVLGSYDDERAAATLKAFADVSRKTQVILFTHHRHLLSIAKNSVPVDALFIQDLTA